MSIKLSTLLAHRKLSNCVALLERVHNPGTSVDQSKPSFMHSKFNYFELKIPNLKQQQRVWVYISGILVLTPSLRSSKNACRPLRINADIRLERTMFRLSKQISTPRIDLVICLNFSYKGTLPLGPGLIGGLMWSMPATSFMKQGMFYGYTHTDGLSLEIDSHTLRMRIHLCFEREKRRPW